MNKSSYEELPPILVEINDQTYEGSLHSSLGPAICAGLRDETSVERDTYPLDLRPTYLSSERDFQNNGRMAEDWLLVDEDAGDAALIQGKSYYECDMGAAMNQLVQEGLTMNFRSPEAYEMIESYLLVVARPSGVEDPNTDLSKVEKGIAEAVKEGQEVRIAADVYEVFPECWDESPMKALS